MLFHFSVGERRAVCEIDLIIISLKCVLKCQTVIFVEFFESIVRISPDID